MTIEFFLGFFVGGFLALVFACLVLATRNQELKDEVKELRARLNSYMLGAK